MGIFGGRDVAGRQSLDILKGRWEGGLTDLFLPCPNECCWQHVSPQTSFCCLWRKTEGIPLSRLKLGSCCLLSLPSAKTSALPSPCVGREGLQKNLQGRQENRLLPGTSQPLAISCCSSGEQIALVCSLDLSLSPG